MLNCLGKEGSAEMEGTAGPGHAREILEEVGRELEDCMAKNCVRHVSLGGVEQADDCQKDQTDDLNLVQNGMPVVLEKPPKVAGIREEEDDRRSDQARDEGEIGGEKKLREVAEVANRFHHEAVRSCVGEVGKEDDSKTGKGTVGELENAEGTTADDMASALVDESRCL